SPPAPHSLSHFKQSYWQGSGSSPCFQGHWSFKEVKEGSSLEATGPRLAYLASVVARFMGARNQVLWLCEMLPEHMEEDSPSPASQLSAPSEDVPSLFPAPLMYTHTKDLQKYTHTHTYICQ
ncbi:hypothetical protein PO909_027365, partial [Leuciscus waleckii]